MSEPRTLTEIRADMAALTTPSGDTEADHSDADGLLIEALRRLATLLGDPSLYPAEVEELIENYQRVRKWYA